MEVGIFALHTAPPILSLGHSVARHVLTKTAKAIVRIAKDDVR